MASNAGFAQQNWHTTQPFPVEQQLAALVDNPKAPSALPLLLSYMSDRRAADEGMGHEADRAYQAQWQQLQAEMAAKQQASALELAKISVDNPVALTMAQNPGSVLHSLMQGVDLNQFGSMLNAATQAQKLKAFKDFGSGVGDASQGGLGFTPGVASSISGLPMIAVDPAAAAAARIHNEGMIGAAQINAAGRAAGGAKPVPSKGAFAVGPNGTITANFTGDPTKAAANAQAYADQVQANIANRASVRPKTPMDR